LPIDRRISRISRLDATLKNGDGKWSDTTKRHRYHYLPTVVADPANEPLAL
jgi:hypothetical protein